MAAGGYRLSVDSDFRVGEWLVQARLNRIEGRGGSQPVEPKVMEVLLRLARQPGEVVSREELLTSVWSDAVVVDTAVFRAISELRRIFEDDPKTPRVIETVRKRGYRLIAPVQPLRQAPPAGFAGRAKADLRRTALALTLSLLAGGLVATAAAHFRALSSNSGADTRWPTPPTVVASSSELEFSPSLSPDGKSLAYVLSKAQPGGRELWKIAVKLAADPTPRILNPGEIDECSPSWSPDGNSIAFWSYGPAGSELTVAPALGGPVVVLAKAPRRTGRDTTWTPDGRWIAASWTESAAEPRSVYLVASDGSGVGWRLTRASDGWYGDDFPSVSPDGKWLAFVRSSVPGAEQDLYVVELPKNVPTRPGTDEQSPDTRDASLPYASLPLAEPRRLTYDRKPIRGLSWRPDSAHLVFSSKRSNQYALWQIALADGEPRWTGIADARFPSIARQENQLVYEHVEREINVWRADLVQRKLDREPLIQSTRIDRAPHFRYDGKSIVFASERTGHFEIWTSDSDGTNLRQVTEFQQYATRPRWSHDGLRLAFQADVDGNQDIYVVDSVGASPRRLTQDPATDQAPAWSADGRWIYFASIRGGNWQIWKIASGGGQATQVTEEGGFTARESADGRWLYYSRPSDPGLWRRPVGEGPPERLRDRFPHRLLGGWDLVGNRVIYAQRAQGGVALILLDPETGESQLLSAMPPGTGIDLTVSPDLETVLFTHVDRRASDVYKVRLPS